MANLYYYSPVSGQHVTLIPGRDSDNALEVLGAFDGLPEHTFLIDEEQLQLLRQQLAAPQPADTVWGLDPTDAVLTNLGVHPGEDPKTVWLHIRPPYTMSQAQAQQLFGLLPPPAQEN